MSDDFGISRRRQEFVSFLFGMIKPACAIKQSSHIIKEMDSQKREDIMEENKRRMTREEIIQELREAWEEELKHTSIDDLKAMIEKLDGDKVDVIDGIGQVISKPELEESYEGEIESDSVQEEAEPYGVTDAEDDDDINWDEIIEEDEEETGDFSIADPIDGYNENHKQNGVNQRKEPHITSSEGRFEQFVPREIYYWVSFLYILDAISEYEEDEPFSQTDIQNILQSDNLKIQSKLKRKKYPLFERHQLKKIKPDKEEKAKLPSERARFPSIKVIGPCIKALIFAHNSTYYRGENIKVGERLGYINPFRTFKSSDCKLMAFLILTCSYISKEEKKSLLEALLRYSPKNTEDQILDMMKHNEQPIRFSSATNPAKEILDTLETAMLGHSLTTKEGESSLNPRCHFRTACQCRGPGGEKSWIIFNPDRWVWKEHGKLAVEGKVSYEFKRENDGMFKKDESARGQILSLSADSLRHVLILDGQEVKRLEELKTKCEKEEKWLEEQKKAAAAIRKEIPQQLKKMEMGLKERIIQIREEQDFCNNVLNNPEINKRAARNKRGKYEKDF